MVNQPLDAALATLVAAARRSDVARRLSGDVETRLLQSIVDATVQLFDAEAASIALFEQDPDRLEFRVAAGEQGAGAVGLTVPPTQGIAGYVYSTGQALALSDVASDPRFNRDAAEQTGYVPRSIAAAPLFDEHGTLGVLQVLDKRGSPTFSLRDMELLAVFAAQATAALAAATRDLDADAESPFWQLVDQIARLRSLTDRETALVVDILRAIAAHVDGPARRGRQGR